MQLKEQLELWNQNDEYQKIIDAIEALSSEEKTPELISDLARAYNNLASAEDRHLFHKAIELLSPLEDELGEDHCWNFRIAYAYYYLDEEGPALHYFERALKARPGDEDTQEMIDSCRQCLALPRFEKSFRERTQEGWASFLAGEAELRSMIDEKADGQSLTARCSELLSPAFADIAFEMGHNGEKYKLILTSEGDRAELFAVDYFCRRAPAEVLRHWNIWAGRQSARGFALRALGQEISAKNVQVWAQRSGEDQVSLALYCAELLPLLEQNEGQTWWLLSLLLDQTLGEIPAMALVDGFDVLEAPNDPPSISLEQLPETLKEMGLDIECDAERLLDRYTAYEMKQPERDPDADLRLDVFAGVTRCTRLINEYLEGESRLMDRFHRDAVVPGFLYYPLDCFDDVEERGKAMLDFRDSLQAAIEEKAGEDAVTFLGGASGLYYGYLDFIAWDLGAVLNAAVDMFSDSPVEWSAFHTFRRDVGGIAIKREAQDDESADSGE